LLAVLVTVSLALFPKRGQLLLLGRREVFRLHDTGNNRPEVRRRRHAAIFGGRYGALLQAL
jgi:hypothetical protein